MVVYQYNINDQALLQVEEIIIFNTPNGDIEKLVYTVERQLLGHPNLKVIIQGVGLRKVNQTQDFQAEESYTIVSIPNLPETNNHHCECNHSVVYQSIILERTNMVGTVDANGTTKDGTYKSIPDCATIKYNNQTGLRTMRFK